MADTFDLDKDAANIEKHGISLSRAGDMEVLAIVASDKNNETRFRAYGLIDGVAYCLVYTVREDQIRAISLRRAHAREISRYAS